jgi:hypothetical protein
VTWLSPTAWSNISVVTLAVLVCAGMIVAVSSGRLIPRSLHKEIIGDKDQTISHLRSRGVEDAATIKMQAETIAKHDGADLAAIRLLQATRNAVSDS